MSIRTALLTSTILAGLSVPASATDVVTQHNDVSRTGLNNTETVLTTSNVKTGSFGIQHTVTLDDQVDAQPLVLSGFTINGASHTVVYVVTENNTVYAIDAATGTVLVKRNLGAPVPSPIFGNCNNDAGHIGIDATPVIDRAAGKLYVVTDSVLNSTTAVYKLHALSLTTLADSPGPVTVTATHKLSDGTTFTFQANHMRQRAALLEANSNIYVAFTSYCDFRAGPGLVRGLVLGYKASSLTALPANFLSNTQPVSGNQFLSTIWMSGNGLAESSTGSIFFVTGNSQNGTYSATTNLEESVINLSSDLTHVLDFFTPSNVNSMSDEDFGAGGVMLIPSQTRTTTKLATALGKDGRLFLLNQASLGKFSTTTNNVLQTISSDACWCAESYYKGPTGAGRVVTSGRSHIVIWQINTSPKVSLTKFATLSGLVSGQDPGFFTAISANGNTTNTIIIWAVSRPTNTSPANVTLYAYNVANNALLFSATAGTWPHSTANANIMPTVANGQVFVASFKQLTIFGPGGKATIAAAPLVATSATPIAGAPNEVSGWIDQINGNLLTIKKRDGTKETIDDTQAVALGQMAAVGMEDSITAFGTIDPSGTFQAQTIVRAKDNVALWPPDM